jgi:hypothetical protein
MPPAGELLAEGWRGALVRARYEALIGEAAAARRRFTRVAAEAGARGFALIALEAELARAGSLRGPARTSVLAALAKRAAQLGVVHLRGLPEPAARPGR